MSDILLYIAGGSILLGAFFGLLAALGILRLPDLYTRMHAASKAGTLGAGLIFFAILILNLAPLNIGIILLSLAGFLFLLFTAPISAHLLARATYIAGYKPDASTQINALEEKDIDLY